MKPFSKIKTEEIRFSRPEDIPALKKMWKVCFEDMDEAIDAFFNGIHGQDSTLILLNQGEAAAMLTMIPARLHSPFGSYSGYYIYAVATLPAYRGKGYMRSLEQECSRITKERHKQFCLLVPATQPLFAMYAKLGYTCFSSASTTKLIVDDRTVMEEPAMKDCPFSEFYRMRTKYLSGFYQSVRFDKAYEQYAYTEYLRSGGLILQALGGYLCCYSSDSILQITESSLSKNQLESLLPLLLPHTTCTEAFLRTSGTEPFSMIKWLENEKTIPFLQKNSDWAKNYFGFALE
ncbi:GNAT family N-acetyltransferase [Scatolibacter rhodanostii]|uniref:GNAT family N-acetyltransferase n=1 Tax=Scatolibacter rhodanostii TaxID=2014781 RepID=UPI000C0734E5|nr:GNAT family N-acetyltransferase [Scatolibacter rhodanostii]